MNDLKLITIEQICQLLQLKKSNVRSKILNRKIPHIKLGSSIRFDQTEIYNWIESQKREVKND